MKNLRVKKSVNLDWSLTQVHAIDVLNWPAYDHKPKVTFKLLHTGVMLFVQFEVAEYDDVRAEGKIDQDPVYQDSCVEFFFLRKDGDYLNFEFNSKGVLLSALGSSRNDRKPLGKDALQRIERHSSGILYKNGKNHWQLTVGIPFDILCAESGGSYRANFYKCGDLTPKSHYLSWSPIYTERPDFHRPEFFGLLTFEQ